MNKQNDIFSNLINLLTQRLPNDAEIVTIPNGFRISVPVEKHEEVAEGSSGKPNYYIHEEECTNGAPFMNEYNAIIPMPDPIMQKKMYPIQVAIDNAVREKAELQSYELGLYKSALTNIATAIVQSAVSISTEMCRINIRDEF